MDRMASSQEEDGLFSVFCVVWGGVRCIVIIGDEEVEVHLISEYSNTDSTSAWRSDGDGDGDGNDRD